MYYRSLIRFCRPSLIVGYAHPAGGIQVQPLGVALLVHFSAACRPLTDPQEKCTLSEAATNVAASPGGTLQEFARQHGFDVRLGWSLDQCGYAVEQFHAVTSIDVFYYSWSPLDDLRTYCRLLRPGGVLAMRITNKRFALGVARRLTAAGPTRDALLSKMLIDQFHAISLGSLSRILQKVGFQRICCEPHASTIQFRSMSWKTRTSYLVADAVWLATFGCANVSPGVIVYAQKPASS